MPSLRTVRRITPAEMVSLDHAFKAPAFRHADRINVIPRGEKRRAEYVSWFHFFGEIPKFANAFHSRAIEFLDVAEHWLGDTILFLVVEAELYGAVTVRFLRLALHDAIRSGENDGHRGDDTLRVINTRLAKFF